MSSFSVITRHQGVGELMATSSTANDGDLARIHGEVAVAYAGAGFGDDWNTESPRVLEALNEIQAELAGLFTFERVIGVGGTGIAFRMRDERLGPLARDAASSVVKIPRPYTVFGQVIANESERLVGLRHENLVRVQLIGVSSATSIPFFVMEAVDEAKDADDWLRDHPSIEEVIRVTEGLIRGLAHLHARGIAHLDLKPANVFVNSDSVIVADLGFAKRVGIDGVTSRFGWTRGYTHPEYEELMSEMKSAGARTYAREALKTEWDLYSLGMTLAVMLRVLSDHGVDVTTYAFRYLKLMAHRMLGREIGHGLNESRYIHAPGGSRGRFNPPLLEPKYLGLNQAAFGMLAYHSISEVSEDIDKLTGRIDLLKSIPELQEFPRDVIQAASHGSAPFSDRIARLVQLPDVHRLARVDQLGLVRLVYPTATHSRLEHSMGTLAMAVRFVRALYNDPVSPLFKQLMGPADFEVLLAVCLLHDIGHYPLAHDLEEVDDLFSHESRTLTLLKSRSIADSLGAPEWSPGVAERVASVLGQKDGDDRSVQDMLIRAVIDGPVDADKLDYLLRDSENLRLPYGRGVDVPKLLQSLTVIVKSGAKASDSDKVFARIGISDKGRIAAESVAFARYSLYGSVYWHRTHRTLKAMLNRLGYEALAAHELSLAPKQRGAADADAQRRLYQFLDEEEGAVPLVPLDRIENVDLTRFFDPHLHDRRRYFDARTEQVILWLVTLIKRERWAQNPANRHVAPSASSFEQLAADTLARRLYDRVCVISRSRTDLSKSDWSKVDRIFGATGKNWRRRLDLTSDLQASVVTAVEARLRAVGEVPDPDLTVEQQGVLQRFVEAARLGAPLLLVDFPPHKTGSRHSLEYRREDVTKLGEKDPFDFANVERSSVWTQLSTAYRQSLGKLRIYCDPEYSRSLAIVLNNDKMQQVFLTVLAGSVSGIEAGIDDDDEDL